MRFFTCFRNGRWIACLLIFSSLTCVRALADPGPACHELPTSFTIDRIWGGTSVRYSAIETSKAYYVGYYDAERWLAVSRVDKCSGDVKKVRLDSRFEGWDAHNYVAMSLDAEGRVHVAGNMHASPMVYARMGTAEDLGSLSLRRETAATQKDRVTYPSFFRFPDGALGLSYRVGQSGDGVDVIDRFDGAQWHRWLDRPLFSSTPGQPPVNAYPTSFVRGPDGMYHVAWVWRSTYKVESNHDVCYARSRDLRHWETSKGVPLALPITPATAEVVDPVVQGQGLFNNIRLGFDNRARPTISYLKFDAQGATQLHHAILTNFGWQIRRSTRWTYRWDPRGGGTIPPEVSFGGVTWLEQRLLERVSHPVEGANVTLRYDPESFEVVEVLRSFKWPDAIGISRPHPAGTLLSAVPAVDSNSAPRPSAAFSWISLPADNRDLPRLCRPEVADCSYAFDLKFHRLDVPAAR